MESYVLVPKLAGRGYDRIFKSDVAWRNAMKVARRLRVVLEKFGVCKLAEHEKFPVNEGLLYWGREILIAQREKRSGWKEMLELIAFLSENWDQNGCPHPKSGNQFVEQLRSIRSFRNTGAAVTTDKDESKERRDRLIFKLIGRRMKNEMDLSILGEFCRKHISCMRLGKLGEEYLDEKTLNELLK